MIIVISYISEKIKINRLIDIKNELSELIFLKKKIKIFY